MSQPNCVRARYETLRELDWTAVTANYVAVGTSLDNPVRIIKFSNLTDSNIKLSLDGLTDEDIVPSNHVCLYDIGSNKSNQGGHLEVSEGEQIYIKAVGALPTRGVFYVTVMYVSNV